MPDSSSEQIAFTSRSLTWKLHSYQDAIERHLRSEVDRTGASRAFVISSPSIERNTATLDRIRSALGNCYAGTYAGIESDSTFDSVSRATQAARSANADLIVAVGGGSVIVAARAVDIFLCESKDPLDLMTQYPNGKPAFSPRLDAPKLPIINVVTTPTSAMNRAGTGLKNANLDHRMEYFDPKTRPAVLIWDWQALKETPFSIIRSTATTTFSGSFGGALRVDPNPLVQADRRQAFVLARRAFAELPLAPDSIHPRLDLCAAAFLANRAEDDGTSRMITGSASLLGDYAVSTALHVRYPHVGQGESSSVLTATCIRRSTDVAGQLVLKAAEVLGIWQPNMEVSEAREALARAFEDMYRAIGMPTHIAELNIPRSDLPLIAHETVKNFNANAGSRSGDDQVRHALELLEAAW